ncbi:hypothetical protein HJG60_011425 [Phyllostomus discolor]|uniref:Uncharacterized protein n=1 Tax=Phyllostomus discolor TaxID=89673 RepID=A0A834A7P3_9CHIR|nr:hypothetical protein HJG60_011425 [Phyllostomus discolor]
MTLRWVCGERSDKRGEEKRGGPGKHLERQRTQRESHVAACGAPGGEGEGTGRKNFPNRNSPDERKGTGLQAGEPLTDEAKEDGQGAPQPAASRGALEAQRENLPAAEQRAWPPEDLFVGHFLPFVCFWIMILRPLLHGPACRRRPLCGPCCRTPAAGMVPCVRTEKMSTRILYLANHPPD